MLILSIYALLLMNVSLNAFVVQHGKLSPIHASQDTSRSVLAATEMSKSLPFLEYPKNLKGLTGDKGFDPIGFTNLFDPRFLREAELKHCRVAMLAAAGFVASDLFKLPGDMHNVSPVLAHDAAVEYGAMFQLLMFIVALEAISTNAVVQMFEGSGRQPGEFSFDPLGFSKGKSDKVKADYAMKELENGRLAMLAFGGMVTQAVLNGKDFPYY